MGGISRNRTLHQGGIPMKDSSTFAEYYKYYLTLHQNKTCRRLHALGQLTTLLVLAYIIWSQLWFLLLFLPFVVYPFAWSGHYFFEGNKPAAFVNPFYAKLSDWIMFKDILLGRLKIW